MCRGAPEQSGEPLRIPSIAPVASDVHRPLWSVMIPAYNCARYLRQSLESVLVQDLGPSHMQIEVVDDRSTEDDPEEVVREIGGGRVGFHRNPQNLGASANFNRCIELAVGQLIHILHGDDFVAPNFYAVIGKMAEQNPDCSFFATRTLKVDEKGIPKSLSRRTMSLEVPSNSVAETVMSLPFQTPSVVIRRSFYERHGGFDTTLVHCADWEMWVRAISHGGGLVNTEPLGCYRRFEGNDSSRLKRTAENVRDQLRLVDRFAALPGFHKSTFIKGCADLAWSQARKFTARGDSEAARSNLKVYRQIEPLPNRLLRSARAGAKRAMQFAGIS